MSARRVRNEARNEARAAIDNPVVAYFSPKAIAQFPYWPRCTEAGLEYPLVLLGNL